MKSLLKQWLSCHFVLRSLVLPSRRVEKKFNLEIQTLYFDQIEDVYFICDVYPWTNFSFRFRTQLPLLQQD